MKKSDTSMKQMLFSPYRCQHCLTRFWVVSRKTYGFARAVTAAIVTVVVFSAVLSGVVLIASTSHDSYAQNSSKQTLD
jgi:hypothetical protein